MKSIKDALTARFSTRKFIDKPVSSDLLRELLVYSNQSPSGGNLQPWRIYIPNNNGMKKFSASVAGIDEPSI